MDYEKGLVSLIMPSYNHGQFIEKTFESIINQTYKNIELIILDDGSIDNTRDIILSYKERLDQRVKKVVIIFKENEGVCKTINRGIRISKGEFYYLIASDDIIMPNFISEHISFLNSNTQYACSYSDGIHLDTVSIENNEFEHGTKFSKDLKFYSGDYRSFVLEEGNLIKLPSPGFVYRKYILRKIGMYDEELNFEDIDMLLRISRNFKIGAIQKVLCIHRLHENNTGRDINKMAKAMQQLYFKYKNDMFYTNEEKSKLLTFLEMYFEWEKKGELLKNKIYMDLVGNREIVLWGASGGGKEFIEKYPEVKISFLVDSIKKNTIFNGFEVKCPTLLNRKSSEYYIITTVSSRYYLELRELLKNYGFVFLEDYC